MAAIRAIDPGDVHRICSGQVIIDLCSGVKELVENALDARASRVEVKLYNFGLDAFEVVDNGMGIAESNRASVCLKHWTSKLQSFEDLQAVSSFGFRGEALSSLCETASQVSITTRCGADEHATKLAFNREGVMESAAVAAGPKGTSVVVTRLFEKLPVRRKDFEKHFKKHYANLLLLMQAYAIISTGVKFSLVHYLSDGKKTVAISTQGVDRLGPNLASVFGFKFLEELLEIDWSLAISANRRTDRVVRLVVNGEEDGAPGHASQISSVSTASSSATSSALEIPVRIVGYVSKMNSGIGRAGSDRQFFFLNGRPVDAKKFAKAVNEAWRQFEMNHKPACVLNVILPPGSFDVNVTPDKREVMIEREQEIIDRFKDHLIEVWDPTRYTFSMTSSLSSQTVQSMLNKPKSQQGEEEEGEFEIGSTGSKPSPLVKFPPVQIHQSPPAKPAKPVSLFGAICHGQ